MELLFDSVLFDPATNSISMTAAGFLTCTAASIGLGLSIAIVYMASNKNYRKGFLITVALMPCIVQTVIMIVNGNLGTGIAVMGAFSLVRFRSSPGKAQEILTIFLAMAVGLATGMGYLGIALLFVVITCGVNLVLSFSPFGGRDEKNNRMLKITVPEDLNYTDAFDDIWKEYTTKASLSSVRTSHMGSLYKLEYLVTLKDIAKEKDMIDALRTRNGNLEIVCGHSKTDSELL